MKDASIDGHAYQRVVPMQVLSLGMPKTGTTCQVFPAMHAALQILGYNDCYHFRQTEQNAQEFEMWTKALAAKYEGKGKFERAELDKLLGRCMAVAGAPCSFFGPELMDAYPAAKVIFVERDVERWFDSFSIIIEDIFDPLNRVTAFLDPSSTGRKMGFLKKWMLHRFHATTLREARAAARDAYRAYYEEIRSVTPKERLLEYKLGSGWEPLCKFLGKDVPDVPFPRVNEGAAFKERVELAKRKGIQRAQQNVAGGILIGLGIAVGLYSWWNRV
ncbi:hypothetical protein FB45DRAFT_742124 [Roridomyces roridus]|uniref:P-loop containing nucleoside triphosphate hydrolase protein n=1 Tax=Roridomyces roridus TaxID=1738132 RepID=A0AAD7C1Y0_9AGAR|nr:hypothetical protein FB45DRAFT_742124 [Roridomyces roridus]